MRPDIPCITSFQQGEALRALQDEAEKISAPLYEFGKNWLVRKGDDNFTFTDHNGDIVLPLPSLIGDHQIINAGNAIAACTLLDGLDISGENIAAGLKNAKWPGRLEQITTGRLASDLPGGWELWFDGGHNEAGGYAMAQMTEYWNDKPLYVICGTTRGKDVAAFLAPLKGKVTEVCGVRVRSEYDSYNGKEITDMASKAGLKSKAFSDVDDAIEYIIAKEDIPARILVFGSLFFMVELTH